MVNDIVIDRAFTEAFNELNKYYEDDELDTCVGKARELLQDVALPRDWREGRGCCLEADTLWRFVRRLNRAGENDENNAAIDELRDYILELRAVLDQEQAKAGDGEDVDDDETAVQARLEDYKSQLAEDEAFAEAENDSPEPLLAAADAKDLSTSTAALRDLDIRKP